LFATPGGAGAPTLDAEADFTSFDSDGFTWNWTDASPGVYFITYFVMKGAVSAGDAVPQVWAQYRRRMS
jgi:hypothetical protein